MDFLSEIVSALEKHLGKNVSLEIPPSIELGDYALPCFPYVKKFKKNPQEIAQDLAKKVVVKNVQVQPTGPYLNFFIDKVELAKNVVPLVIEKNFGKDTRKETVVIDYSAPNVAKHMGIHNLRSTVIGHALYNIYSYRGFKTKGTNYLGDWGTNFGQLTVAVQKWSSIEKIKKGGVKELNRVYVKFHQEAEKQPSLLTEAKQAFKALDEGDVGAKKFWKLFRDVSLQDYQKIYDRLGVTFDEVRGESSAIKDIPKTLEKLKKFSKKDEGALIIELPEKTPCMLVKSDETSTYALRDLATAFYRLEKYKPKKVLYVVDVAQKLHFEQIFEVMKKVDKKNEEIFFHVVFGRLSFPDKSMSTRKGNIIILEEVLDKSVEKVKKIINEKNPKLKNKAKVAEQVGVGAIVFNDLFQDRENNITFTWDKVLDFEGSTSPYIQYSYARCNSILKKYGKKVTDKVEYELLTEDAEYKLIKAFHQFPEVLDKVIEQNKPSHLAKYLVDLAYKFNEFYVTCQVIGVEKEIQEARVLLVLATKMVLGKGLELLGIDHPEEM